MAFTSSHERAPSLSPERRAAVKAELATILRSSFFSGSKRCQDFLEFIVNHALENNYDYLTERFLGAELFGRPINYETGTDSIVRVRANDVRRRLTQYYAEHHGNGPVVIELVSGSYVPEFHWREVKLPVEELALGSPVDSAHRAGAAHDESGSPLLVSSGRGARWLWMSAAVVVIAAVAFWAGGWTKQRTLNPVLYPLKSRPAMNALWSPLVDSTRQSDIVLSDVSFQLLEDLEKRSYSLTDYLNRSYLGDPQVKNASPEMRSILALIASKNFGNSSEFRLAERMAALDRTGNRIQIYNARDYSSTLAGQDNMILIGSQYSNPWQQLFAPDLNFKENPPGVQPGAVVNTSPKAGERAVYTPTDAVGYCVVAYLPNPDRGTRVLLIEGTSSEATEAGGDFLLSEDKFSGFEKILRGSGKSNFEVLLKTSQVRGTPIAATVEAYRTY